MTGDDCRTWRLRKGWSVDRLAELSGLSDRTILDFENGLRQPRAGTLIALRKAFKVGRRVTGEA
ncbi:MAG TPA: helix-turn-helix transcriptional regulator [Caulobacter sp.]|nr:helix-turn-helix transcriptional regulator [Caulobacter sp.]